MGWLKDPDPTKRTGGETPRRFYIIYKGTKIKSAMF